MLGARLSPARLASAPPRRRRQRRSPCLFAILMVGQASERHSLSFRGHHADVGPRRGLLAGRGALANIDDAAAQAMLGVGACRTDSLCGAAPGFGRDRLARGQSQALVRRLRAAGHEEALAGARFRPFRLGPRHGTIPHEADGASMRCGLCSATMARRLFHARYDADVLMESHMRSCHLRPLRRSLFRRHFVA